MTLQEVSLKCRGGGCFSHIKPKFSECEESIFVAKKNHILQYSTKTGLPLGKYENSEYPIVGFGIDNVHLSECLITCSNIGEITVWKTVTHFKTISQKIECSNIKIFQYLPNKYRDNNVLEAVIIYNESGRKYVSLVNITKGNVKNYKLKLKGEHNFIAVNHRRFFAVADRRRIHFVDVDNPEKSSTALLAGKKYPEKYFTCLECHSEEEIVITGDSEGKVTLWHNVFSKEPPRSIYHWHTLPVNCLAFSSTGSYFYSGGNESVLVRWDWDNSQNKKFLPRLSGLIHEIGVSDKSKFIAVSTSDSAIKILDSAFNDVSLIQHLVVGDNHECGIALDPRTKSLVMNGSVGQIQFYSPHDSTLLYSMDVVGQNKLTDERKICLENTRVTKFAISQSGLWLVSVEERRDPVCTHQEMRMKFWKFDTSCQKFELNTCIEKPHQNSVTAVAFQTSNVDDELKCVTVGDDKKFKVWHKTIIQKVNIDCIVWTCLCIGFYRNLPCKGLSFSADGSLVGIGFDRILTTWTPDTCQLKCSLVYPNHRENIKDIQFGTSGQCHLVVTATKNRLTVWNLLSLTMVWTVTVEVEFLLADRMSVYMAVITRDKEIFVFSPDSPDPVYSSDEVLVSKDIMAAAFIPSRFCLDVESEWYKRVELYLIDSNKELFSIGVESSEEYLENDKEDDTNVDMLSLYNKMLPQKKVSRTFVNARHHLFQKDVSHKSVKEYLAAPLHTMIPIRLTCSSLIKSFIVQKNS